MCNQYKVPTVDALLDMFNLRQYVVSPEVAQAAGADVRPTDPAVVLTSDQPHELQVAHWGFLAPWSERRPSSAHPDKLAPGFKPHNARDDRLLVPPWRDALEHHRCLVPAASFFEYGHVPPHEKKKLDIGTASGEPLCFAGLWSRYTWKGVTDRLSCTVITTTPNEAIAAYHDRMPVILPRSTWDTWLQSTDVGALSALLRPIDSAAIRVHEVLERQGRLF
jgi:putative SOS response-associated peptidase YedK